MNYVSSQSKPEEGDKGFIVGDRFVKFSGVHKEIELVSPTNMTSFENEQFELYTTGQVGDRYLWKAFDGNMDTWCDARGSKNPRYFGWRRKDGFKNTCMYYEIYNKANSTSQDNMCEWSLQGSNDGVNYTEIHHVSNCTYWVRDSMLKFEVNDEKNYYTYFKIICIKSGNNSTELEYVPFIREFKMYGYVKKA